MAIRLNKKQIVEDLRYGIYVRLMPSSLGGVGVFAIKDIPAGINPFGDDDTGFEKIPVNEICNDNEIPDAVKKYAEDIGTIEKGYLYVPNCGLNNITPSFFLNHSVNPNMKAEDEGEYFIALREIKAGEELTVDYHTYNDNVAF